MDEESIDNIESINDETEEVLNTEEVEETGAQSDTEDTSDNEDIEALKEKLSKSQEANKKLFERAKKAEAEAKAKKAEVKPEVQPTEKQVGISPMDAIALVNAKVTNQEDINEVLDYAKLKGLSIEKALSASVVQTILKENAEKRQTAEATSIGNARRGTAKVTDEQILSNAESGKFPEDPEALAEARINIKKNRK